MDPNQLRLIINWTAGAMIAAGVGGLGFAMANNLRMSARRQSRLAGEAVAEKPALSLATGAVTQMMKSAGQVGNRMAVRDPTQVTALRQKLIQSGFMSKEAVPIYLGAKFTCLVIATVTAFLVLPYIILKGGNLPALVLVAFLAFLGVFGPDKV